MGATVAGSDDLLEDMSAGNLDFDLLITTPQLMPMKRRTKTHKDWTTLIMVGDELSN
jgi:ribosomal protein L1